MDSLTSLGWQIHDHLKELRPKLFQELKDKNRLHPFVKALENQANDQMDELEDSGLQPHEAWEIVKDKVLLPTETDVPSLNGTIQPYSDLTPLLQQGTTSPTPKASPSPLDKKPSTGPTSKPSSSSKNSTLKVV